MNLRTIKQPKPVPTRNKYPYIAMAPEERNKAVSVYVMGYSPKEKNFPRYTETRDHAWIILQKCVEDLKQFPPEKRERFVRALGGSQGVLTPEEIARVTPEIIGLAALLLYDVIQEVEG